MGPLVDQAEKHEFAAHQPLVDVVKRAEHRRKPLDRDRGGARLALGNFDDQVLSAPDRDEHTRRDEDALANPLGLAAAQASSFEAGMGILMGGSHGWETGTARPAAATRVPFGP